MAPQNASSGGENTIDTTLDIVLNRVILQKLQRIRLAPERCSLVAHFMRRTTAFILYIHIYKVMIEYYALSATATEPSAYKAARTPVCTPEKAVRSALVDRWILGGGTLLCPALEQTHRRKYEQLSRGRERERHCAHICWSAAKWSPSFHWLHWLLLSKRNFAIEWR